MTLDGSGVPSVDWVPSDPGVTFVKDSGVVVSPPADDGEWKALTPCVVAVPRAGFRLYCTLSGRRPGVRADPRASVIVSCRSSDALAWEPEPGMRFSATTP